MNGIVESKQTLFFDYKISYALGRKTIFKQSKNEKAKAGRIWSVKSYLGATFIKYDFHIQNGPKRLK